LNAEGITIILITHFMEEAAQADRIIVLNKGRVVLSGPPSEVLVQTDVLETLNLEVPFACKLSQSLRKGGLDVPICVTNGPLLDSLYPLVQNKPALRDAAKEEKASAQGKELITLEHVCYSYDSASKKRAKALKKSAKKDKSVRPNGKVAWGNEPDALWALKDVSLTINEGEFFGIAGHTGSGKSTLIQHLNGIVSPTLGRVLVKGKDVSEKNHATEVRSMVGVVFQYPEHQLFADTVYNDVAFGPRNLGLSSEEVELRIRQSLESVDLDFDTIAERNPFELSGGQQRRVAFAGVLAMKPEVLVLDEPVAGLDPAAKRDFLNLILRLHKEAGLTVIMVSHNMDDLAECCDRIAVLSEGTVAHIGTPGEIFVEGEEMNRIGLGVPSAQVIAESLRLKGAPLDKSYLYDLDTLTRDILLLASSPAE
ncbi:MAG: ATP-binding cassette domain-containing protein, partial [Anaerotardibacter sp.]